MAARMKDIAVDLGLSVVTVSKALRDHPDIGEATRRRVLERATELGYQPNLTARSLVTGQSWTIGLIVPDLLHPFFAGIAKAISGDIRPHGYGLLISSSDEDAEVERQQIRHLLARQVDVIVLASTQATADGLRDMAEQRTPHILLDRRFADADAHFVGNDDEAVGALATRHLIAQGCRRIAHLRGPAVSTAAGRLAGYRQALAEHGLPPAPGHVADLGPSGDHRGEEAGYAAARRLLAMSPRPDGLFCYNDPSALGAMRAVLEMGLSIPGDIAIIGCGNLSYADFLRIPLSSIDQGAKAIGQRVADLAVSLAGTRNLVGRNLVGGNLPDRNLPAPCHVDFIPPRLVARASTLRFNEE
ncbi:LacI family DNA-binding transcriptional regulator [Nitrospirillum pindoramense]|uniref:LacI family transcriptional regulator n=1 Tax=Nitrospirillum amazonense TaxID=28077 RepID=A0A560GKP6_9PROT|nr:LacI family DNA-binding transcriptional regulator [Nitrospirillum amazonense]TWB34552.1 LacI family transcriptional regulator [Nitrospirillum amazonense]